MTTFVKFLNGDIISIDENKDMVPLALRSRKAAFEHIKENRERYEDLMFYQQIELNKDDENFLIAFIRPLDTFSFKEVIPWIMENCQEKLESYVQYLAEKRMIMALSSGFGFELHFIDRYIIDKNPYSWITPNFTSICWSTVLNSDIKDRTSKNFPFSRVVLEDNDNLREYGYGFQLLDHFPIRIGQEIVYVSTHLP